MSGRYKDLSGVTRYTQHMYSDIDTWVGIFAKKVIENPKSDEQGLL